MLLLDVLQCLCSLLSTNLCSTFLLGSTLVLVHLVVGTVVLSLSARLVVRTFDLLLWRCVQLTWRCSESLLGCTVTNFRDGYDGRFAVVSECSLCSTTDTAWSRNHFAWSLCSRKLWFL